MAITSARNLLAFPSVKFNMICHKINKKYMYFRLRVHTNHITLVRLLLLS